MKFICKECTNPCVIETNDNHQTVKAPAYCPIEWRDVKWEEVPDAQQD